MQCPKCKYEPTMAEMQRSPEDCVKCGVNYQGHARHVAQKRLQAQQENSRPDSLSPVVREASEEYRGAQPVVVIDVRMSFWSMVWFMVKWVIASIPAMIILVIIGGIVFSLVSAVPAFFEYKARAEASRATNQATPESERIIVPVPTAGEFYAVAVSRNDAIAAMTVRSVFPEGDAAYSRVVVDCEKGSSAVTATAYSVAGLGRPSAPVEQEIIVSGTPRQYIAKHACRGSPRLHSLLR